MLFKKKRLSLSKRIALTYSIILFTILIIFTTLTSYLIRNIYLESNEGEFLSAAAAIEEYMKNHEDIKSQELEKMELGYNVIYKIFSSDGSQLYTSRPEFPDLNVSLEDKPLLIKEQVLNHDILIAYLNKSVHIKDKLYYIQVAKSMGDMGRFAKTLFRILIYTGFIGIIVCLLSGSYLSRKVLKPIRHISNTAKELTSKSLDKRISVDGPDDDLKELSNTFNLMLERLETDFEKQRRFVYDASHELRTPLSVIYGNVNMLARWGKDNPEVLSKALATLKYETENMNKLITDLLYLARSDSNKLILKNEEFHLNTLLKEVVDETLLVHSDYAVTYTCSSEHIIKADYNAVKQVLRILLDNSVKFSPPPGDIVLEAVGTSKGTAIHVTDKGCGIPAESLPYIFDRFYRADESRTKSTGGTGLGLSIAKQIMQAHGGTISAQSTLGEGTRIDIFIPN